MINLRWGAMIAGIFVALILCLFQNAAQAHVACEIVYKNTDLNTNQEARATEKEFSPEHLASVQKLTEELKYLIEESENRRTDMDISNLLLQELAPIFKQNTKSVKQKIHVFSQAAQSNLTTELFSKTNESQKLLLQIGRSISFGQKFKSKTLKWVTQWSARRAEKRLELLNKTNTEILQLLKSLEMESISLIAVEQGLREELKKLDSSLHILSKTREFLQIELWELEKTNPTPTIRDAYQNTLIMIDKEIGNTQSLIAITLALKEQVNQKINTNVTAKAQALSATTTEAHKVVMTAKQYVDLNLDEKYNFSGELKKQSDEIRKQLPEEYAEADKSIEPKLESKTSDENSPPIDTLDTADYYTWEQLKKMPKRLDALSDVIAGYKYVFLPNRKNRYILYNFIQHVKNDSAKWQDIPKLSHYTDPLIRAFANKSQKTKIKILNTLVVHLGELGYKLEDYYYLMDNLKIEPNPRLIETINLYMSSRSIPNASKEAPSAFDVDEPTYYPLRLAQFLMFIKNPNHKIETIDLFNIFYNLGARRIDNYIRSPNDIQLLIEMYKSIDPILAERIKKYTEETQSNRAAYNNWWRNNDKKYDFYDTLKQLHFDRFVEIYFENKKQADIVPSDYVLTIAANLRLQKQLQSQFFEGVEIQQLSREKAQEIIEYAWAKSRPAPSHQIKHNPLVTAFYDLINHPKPSRYNQEKSDDEKFSLVYRDIEQNRAVPSRRHWYLSPANIFTHFISKQPTPRYSED